MQGWLFLAVLINIVVVIVIVIVSTSKESPTTQTTSSTSSSSGIGPRQNPGSASETTTTELSQQCVTTPFSSACATSVEAYCNNPDNVASSVCQEYLSVVQHSEDSIHSFPSDQETLMNAAYVREGGMAYSTDPDEFIALMAYHQLYLGKDPVVVNYLAVQRTLLSPSKFAAVALTLLAEHFGDLADETPDALLKYFQKHADYRDPLVPMRDFRQVVASVVSDTTNLPSHDKDWAVLTHAQFHARSTAPTDACWVDYSKERESCLVIDEEADSAAIPCGTPRISPYRDICPPCIASDGTTGYEFVSQENLAKTFFDLNDCECQYSDPPVCVQRTRVDTVHGTYDHDLFYTRGASGMVPLMEANGKQREAKHYTRSQHAKVGVPIPQSWSNLRQRNGRDPMTWLQELFHAITAQQFSFVDNPFVGTPSLADRPAGCWHENESWCHSGRPTWTEALSRDTFDDELQSYMKDFVFRYCQQHPRTFVVGGLYDCARQEFLGL